jgi:ferredoxin
MDHGVLRCGLCRQFCRQVFKEHRADHLVQIRRKYRKKGHPGHGRVPEQLIDALYAAFDECPAELIHVI